MCASGGRAFAVSLVFFHQSPQIAHPSLLLSVGLSRAAIAFQLRPALIFRPEVPVDYNDESRPLENKHGLFTATSDVIVRW